MLSGNVLLGIGTLDNECVANAIKGSFNTIGYVDLNGGLATGIPYLALQIISPSSYNSRYSYQ